MRASDHRTTRQLDPSTMSSESPQLSSCAHFFSGRVPGKKKHACVGVGRDATQELRVVRNSRTKPGPPQWMTVIGLLTDLNPARVRSADSDQCRSDLDWLWVVTARPSYRIWIWPIDIQISTRDVNSCFGSHHQIPPGVRGRALGHPQVEEDARRDVKVCVSITMRLWISLWLTLRRVRGRRCAGWRKRPDGWWHKWPFHPKILWTFFEWFDKKSYYFRRT